MTPADTVDIPDLSDPQAVARILEDIRRGNSSCSDAAPGDSSARTIGITTFSKPGQPPQFSEQERKLLSERLSQLDQAVPIEDFIHELELAAEQSEKQ